MTQLRRTASEQIVLRVSDKQFPHADPLFIPLFPEWFDEAACAGVDLEVFFPERGRSVGAKMLCKGCPVRDECLQYALDGDLEGYWGGTSTRERKQLRRQQAA